MGSHFKDLVVLRLRFINGRYLTWSDADFDDSSDQLTFINEGACHLFVNRVVESWMAAHFIIPPIEVVAEDFYGEICWIKKIYG
jgi:hypothetical protein